MSFPVFTFISLAKDLHFLQNAEGSGLAPFDCWICLRGIKTMALRVEKQQVLFQTCFSVKREIISSNLVLIAFTLYVNINKLNFVEN